ncbi:actin-like ATPase domain-containing protein [Mytilinidion resinicola]|uniref:Phosphotransferase n=1 Tax=Mytilinidion resinicola TaxID=574789 RepID=A0A6A6YW75_9PEZI|nr:actin-like ATPase domain-containing protein [Mytilinidion resinicola]KAF2813051.1 actin-like ATPase domain-containing protein [Mytilinidion resinicola]
MRSSIQAPEDDASLNDFLSPLTRPVTEHGLLDLARRFAETYKQLAKTSTEHFLTTPVTILPTGKEKGKFLTIDVGGTNLRVGFIELLGENETEGVECQSLSQLPSKIRRSHEKSWNIEEHMKMDQAEDLFAWIGDCIAEVITGALDDASEKGTDEAPFGDELPLGITFSFPMTQTSMSEATLMPMGKGFAITSDLNLGKMLLAGYGRHITNRSTVNDDKRASNMPSNKKRKLPSLPRIRIAAITNDTVATFASLAYAVRSTSNSRVAMGLIVGTGTNATVPMELGYLHPEKVAELATPGRADMRKTVVINTEWTIRGTDKPLVDLDIKTKWDLELDRNSEAPGFQPFEYMTAGRYLGEIVRLVLFDLLSKDDSVKDIPHGLRKKNAISTRFLSTQVADGSSLESLSAELEKIIPSRSAFWTPQRCEVVRRVAQAVQQRSSALVAAAIVGLLGCVQDVQLHDARETDGVESNPSEEIIVAYTGGLASGYRSWLPDCQNWVDVLVRKGSATNASKRVVLKEAVDGGVIGAAVLAGMTEGTAGR